MIYNPVKRTDKRSNCADVICKTHFFRSSWMLFLSNHFSGHTSKEHHFHGKHNSPHISPQLPQDVVFLHMYLVVQHSSLMKQPIKTSICPSFSFLRSGPFRAEILSISQLEEIAFIYYAHYIKELIVSEILAEYPVFKGGEFFYMI